jgi:two-component system phosphate regulon sensor histidine kinase PhoR
VRALAEVVPVVAAATPLLAVSLWATREHGGSLALAAVLWTAAAAVVAVVAWRRAVPLVELRHELGTAGPRTNLLARLRELKERLERRERDCSAQADLLEDLTSGIGDGLLVVGKDLRVRLINPRALHFAGGTEVPAGTHLLDILREPDLVRAVEAAAAGERTRRVVVENPRGLWQVRPFPIRGGGAVVLISEVGLIRRSAELRRRFVQDLSHELRSPLAVLRTTVEALEDEVSEAQAAMLIRQVERITRLTDELHELASIESGQVELNPEPQLLLPLLRDLVQDFASPAAALDLELRVEGEEDLTVTCDRRALYRVLSNLVDNAIKYNRPGGSVTVGAGPSEDGIAIVVADSGVGIPADELQAVLQRFYRIDRARTPGEGGLGLGLAIVKHMVQQMGGSLQLDSREGVGTQVTVTVPLSQRVTVVAG